MVAVPPFVASDSIAQDPPTLARQLALDVAARLRRAIQTRGSASLIVSGGSTPVDFLHQLSTQSLQWEKVTVTLADERWVAVDHAQSNERMVRETLLQNDASTARFIGLKNDADTVAAGLSGCEQVMAQLNWPVDVTVLGMGTDGHTASLFPSSGDDNKQRIQPDDRLCLVADAEHLSRPRVSLSVKALLHTHNLLLHIVGEPKRLALKAALDSGDQNRWPVLALTLRGREKLRVYWSPEQVD